MKSFISIRAIALTYTFFSVVANATLSCPSSNNTLYTATDGATYNIECFYDRPNGDISYGNSTSMENCITTCESTSSCIDVAFYPPASGAVNGTCWLKKTLNAGQSNSNVWGGRKVSAAPSSTSSMVTSTTKSSSSSAPTASVVATSTFVQTAAKVTNTAASGSGSGPSATSGPAAVDVYNCYDGNLSSFPAPSKWATYANLWANNSAIMTATCGYNNWGPNDTPAQVQLIGNAIQQVASDSNVDPRFILAVMMQESAGCLNVPTTTSPPPNSIPNPGIMQDYNGTHTWIGNTTANASTAQQSASIIAMLRDGVQGTGATGPSLVKGLNRYANIYEAARNYNSGCVNEKNLNDGISSTQTYVVDIANRMTGWVLANRNYNCPNYVNGGAGDCTASE